MAFVQCIMMRRAFGQLPACSAKTNDQPLQALAVGSLIGWQTLIRVSASAPGALADRAGFEPAVAVTPRTLSKRVP